jgi:hypothetical protein
VQAIAEGVGMAPLGFLPRKDIFHGQRESEVVYAWYYDSPRIGPLSLTPKAAAVASAVLGHAVEPDGLLHSIIAQFECGEVFATEYAVDQAGSRSLVVKGAEGFLKAHVCSI